jgi:ribosomal protein S18 acetylase RimI-like enzyme
MSRIDPGGLTVHIRPVLSSDRGRIQEIVRSSGYFKQVEVATALELVDDALARGETSGYIVEVLESGTDHAVHGYVCYGPTPLTEGTYDLYWIAVDQAARGRGFGQRLLRHVESEVSRRGGRLLLIETSSQESYGSTQRFYEAGGYELAARIRNFYRVGDDKLVFLKELGER